jgi:uncharacterized protein YbcI
MDHNELFFELLHHIRESVRSEEFLEEFRVPNHFVRKGRISMENMVTFLLFHSKLPLDGKLDALREKLPKYDFPKVSKQALSKARYGIRFELFQTLFDNSVSFYYENTVRSPLWQGKYHVFAIDGSDQEVPSSESTFAEFGKQSDQKNPNLFWSMALASVLYDVLEDMVVDAIIEKQAASERELAVRHLSRLVDLGLQDNSIVIFDRGYFSADVFQECVNSGCMCLMRLRNNSLLGNLEGDDAETFITAPDGTKMRCRVLKVILNTGEVELLITNVFDKDISAEMFEELYFERWKIETKYLEIKERWLIEEFTGTGSLAVRQDFYITMLYSNLSAIIKQKADELIEQTANVLNVYQYRARRTYIIGKIQRNFIKWLLTSFTMKDIDEFMLDASKKRSQIQPGRTRKRKRHTRARKHYSNRKSAF